MNQDPNNPIMPNPVAPQAPTNPAAAAAPTIDATPSAPSVPPEAPTIDPSLLQQAIADVPEESTSTTPEVPSAISLDNLGNNSDAATVANADASPFANAAPVANFSTPEQTAAAPVDQTTGAPIENEPGKTTPSVAFNDPAQQPDTKLGKDINFGKIFEKIKKRPVLAIVGGGAIVIIALILILAFAV